MGLDRRISRRHFLKLLGEAGAAGAGIAGAPLSLVNTDAPRAGVSDAAPEGVEMGMQFKSIPITPEAESALEAEKEEIATELFNTFKDEPDLFEHIADNVLETGDSVAMRKKLKQECRIELPTPQECDAIRDICFEQLRELAEAIPEGKYGVFVHGDITDVIPQQTMYLIKNTGKNTFEFVRKYPVSTSKNEWSHKPNSEGTPLGLLRVAEVYRGKFAQVVSIANSKAEKFESFFVREKQGEKVRRVLRTFVNSLVGGPDGDTVAEMVTGRMLLVNAKTPWWRAINIHGTNFTNFLGKRASGGCARVPNGAVWHLLKHVEAGVWNENKTDVEGGTPVMIHGTPRQKKAPDRSVQSNDESRSPSRGRGDARAPSTAPSSSPRRERWSPPGNESLN